MHESSLARQVIAELKKRKDSFREVELEVGALSIHGTQDSLNHFLEHVRKAFPGKKVDAKMVKPSLRCDMCGFERDALQGDITCPKCGGSLSLDLHEGYKILKIA